MTTDTTAPARAPTNGRAPGVSAFVDGVERWLGAAVDAVAAMLLAVDIVPARLGGLAPLCFRVPVTCGRGARDARFSSGSECSASQARCAAACICACPSFWRSCPSARAAASRPFRRSLVLLIFLVRLIDADARAHRAQSSACARPNLGIPGSVAPVAHAGQPRADDRVPADPYAGVRSRRAGFIGCCIAAGVVIAALKIRPVHGCRLAI